LCDNLDKKKVILAPFCGGVACEEKVKKLSARQVKIIVNILPLLSRVSMTYHIKGIATILL
jgi:hypothetical protein